jgi:hypothetical protein
MIQFLMAHGLEILGGIQLVLMGLIAIFAIIPGEQPELFLKKLSDLVGSVSRK